MKELKKVIVIGRGAVGSVMGSLFHEELHENFAFLADSKRKEKYETNPYLINGKETDFQYIGKEDAGSFGKADLILITTKYLNLEEAMDLAAPFMDEQTILMSGINGICSEDDLRKRFENQSVIRTIAQKMDANYHDGQMEYTKTGELVFGADQSNQQEQIEAVKRLFGRAGIPYVCSNDILHDQWSKLMLNCGINQTCAAYDATYGDVCRDEKLRKIFMDAMEEVRKCAVLKGISLKKEEKDDWFAAIEALAPDSMPSMLQDVKAGRHTEIGLFSDTIIPIAQEYGLETPVLSMLKEKIDAYEKSLEAKPSR